MIVREVLDNGLRLITESMPHVRSVTIGVWLTRGSRHESDARSGIAHFVEHMLFKGTSSRSAEDLAQAIDSIGGQLDAFTAKEYASYYIKVLDEHLPLAVDLLSDIVLRPAFPAEEIEREKNVILEEFKMVEDTPDDLVHEVFTENFWAGHPLGRPILGTRESVQALTRDAIRAYFADAYVAHNLVISAAGNIQHVHVRELVEQAFSRLRASGTGVGEQPPRAVPNVIVRAKEIEQSHLCIGTNGYQQDHHDRYVSYILNTVLGGSMSSRLFQNIREKRGLAYAVFSSLSAYRDAGALTIYAGCGADQVDQVVDLVVEELRAMKSSPVPEAELRRAKDHLKGSLMLSLENTASRMSHLARQEIYFDRYFSLDETLEGVERVTAADLQRVAADLFASGGLERPAPVRDLAAGGAGCDRCGRRSWRGAGGGRARASRKGRVRCREDRRDRADHATRRDRVHHRGSRKGRTVGPVAALRDDVLGRARHGPRAADAGRLRSDSHGPRGGRGRHPREGRGTPPHADDRPDARCARRTDDFRPQARVVVRAAAACDGPDPPGARDGERREDFRCRGDLRASRPRHRGPRVRAARIARRSGIVADRAARSPRRAHERAGPRRGGARNLRARDPRTAENRDRRGGGAVWQRTEGVLRHAAQAQPDRLRADLRPCAPVTRKHARGDGEHRALARARH